MPKQKTAEKLQQLCDLYANAYNRVIIRKEHHLMPLEEDLSFIIAFTQAYEESSDCIKESINKRYFFEKLVRPSFEYESELFVEKCLRYYYAL